MEEFRNAYEFSYYWKVERGGIKDEFSELCSDSDVYDMAETVTKEIKFVEVYLLDKKQLQVAIHNAEASKRRSEAKGVSKNTVGSDKVNNMEDWKVNSESDVAFEFLDSENDPSDEDDNL
ncbi:hypothetical protein LINPERPRIM_LOCUS35132, partial [Linum perenne]